MTKKHIYVLVGGNVAFLMVLAILLWMKQEVSLWFVVLMVIFHVAVLLAFGWRQDSFLEVSSSLEYKEFLRTLRNYLSHHKVADQHLKQFYDQLKDLLEKKEQETIALLASINLNLNEQLDIAKRIQRAFMPLVHNRIQRPEFRWAFWYQPAETIGGDLLDIIRVGRNGYALVVADVSGHGIPSALLTSMTKVAFINRSAWGKDPAKVCQDVNKDFLKTLQDVGFYVTAFYAFLNLEEGSLQYTSAGHMPLLYYRARTQTTELLHTRGTVLGVFQKAVFESQILQIEPHDKLFLFTDGLVDITNQKGEWFGIEKLEEVVHRYASLSPERCIDAIRQEVVRFGWGEKNVDDQALMCVEFIRRTKPFH